MACSRGNPIVDEGTTAEVRTWTPVVSITLVTRFLFRLEPTLRAARMRALLDAHLAEPGGGVVERGVRIDPGIADRLRAMGYLR